MSEPASAEDLRTPRYRRRLLFLLSSATSFEGYDTFVLSFVLALVLGDRGGTESAQAPISPLPSEGGPSVLEPVHAAGWLAALAVAGILIALSWALMTIVRRRSPTVIRGSDPHPPSER